jgi:hypothetical protein
MLNKLLHALNPKHVLPAGLLTELAAHGQTAGRKKGNT